MTWLALLGNLIVKGVVTYAQIEAELAALPSATAEKTTAKLLELKAYVAGKYGEAVALSHFGE